jgi:hypothetical protein
MSKLEPGRQVPSSSPVTRGRGYDDQPALASPALGKVKPGVPHHPRRERIFVIIIPVHKLLHQLRPAALALIGLAQKPHELEYFLAALASMDEQHHGNCLFAVERRPCKFARPVIEKPG